MWLKNLQLNWPVIFHMNLVSKPMVHLRPYHILLVRLRLFRAKRWVRTQDVVWSETEQKLRAEACDFTEPYHNRGDTD
jgi:hypothetical protein